MMSNNNRNLVLRNTSTEISQRLVINVANANLQQAKRSRQLFSQLRMSIRFLLKHKATEQSAAQLGRQVIEHTIEQQLGHKKLISTVRGNT